MTQPLTKHEIDESVARAAGMSRSTLVRASYVVQAAKDPSVPDPVRAIARAWLPALNQQSGTRKVWAAYRAVRDAQAAYVVTRPCEECGDRFTVQRPEAIYCSNACRQRAYRARHGPAA